MLLCPMILIPLLTGCETAVSEGTVYTCPPLSEYDPKFEAQVATEMALAVNASWPRMVKDYGRLRAMCRSLQ